MLVKDNKGKPIRPGIKLSLSATSISLGQINKRNLHSASAPPTSFSLASTSLPALQFSEKGGEGEACPPAWLNSERAGGKQETKRPIKQLSCFFDCSIDYQFINLLKKAAL